MTKKEIITEILGAAHISQRSYEKATKRLALHQKYTLTQAYTKWQEGKLAAGYIVHVLTGIQAKELTQK